MRRHVMRMLLALVMLAGCNAGHVRNDPSDQPAIAHLLYYRWHGMSPGAGFTSTRLTAWEVDVAAKRMRGVAQHAHAPEPMLPHERADIETLLEKSPWKEVPAAHMEGLVACIRSWLQTTPPAAYNVPKGLGTEDGYAEALVVRIGARRFGGWDHLTRINPHGGYRADDPLKPPPQWAALVAYLNALGHPSSINFYQPVAWGP